MVLGYSFVAHPTIPTQKSNKTLNMALHAAGWSCAKTSSSSNLPRPGRVFHNVPAGTFVAFV
jgi:hypothetical protein